MVPAKKKPKTHFDGTILPLFTKQSSKKKCSSRIWRMKKHLRCFPVRTYTAYAPALYRHNSHPSRTNSRKFVLFFKNSQKIPGAVQRTNERQQFQITESLYQHFSIRQLPSPLILLKMPKKTLVAARNRNPA